MRTAQEFVELLSAALTASPPPGIDSLYVESFFARQRPALIGMIEELLAERDAALRERQAGTETPEGGRAGEKLRQEGLREEQRIVVNLASAPGEPADLHHGKVARITRMTIRSFTIGPRGMQEREREEDVQEHIGVDVQLDSGRTRSIYWYNEVYEELARPDPERIVPDVLVTTETQLPLWMSPGEFYDTTFMSTWRRIREALDGAERARLPTKKAALRQAAVDAQRRARKALDTYRGWLAHLPPQISIVKPHEKDPVHHRRVELELAVHRTPEEELEWRRVTRADELKSWRALAVGERVIAWFGTTQDRGWWVAHIENGHVTLSRAPVNPSQVATVDAVTVPVWMVDPDPSALPFAPSLGFTPTTETDGCQQVVFEMPRHGRVEVVCGARGRRDVWHNIYIGSVRYGFNGGRWAKGMVPPTTVLDAVRERGITVFGS